MVPSRTPWSSANRRSFSKSSTRSHGMWSATLGSSRVSSCTVAASAIFSNTSRGVPALLNTLKRVPELPNAHEGSSMAWSSSWPAMSVKVVMTLPGTPDGPREVGAPIRGLKRFKSPASQPYATAVVKASADASRGPLLGRWGLAWIKDVSTPWKTLSLAVRDDERSVRTRSLVTPRGVPPRRLEELPVRDVVGAVTLSDVAAEAGVSVATASRALNGSSRRVRDDLGQRVRAAAERLNYTPNAQAQAMARGATTVVGLLVHDISDPYFSAIAAGVSRAAEDLGLLVLLGSTRGRPEEELRYLTTIRAQRGRAAILTGSRRDDPAHLQRLAAEVEAFGRAGGRVVAVTQARLPVDTVVIENRASATAL